jgi:hypothetical protein
MSNPLAVDRTYVVSVKALREILKEISTKDEHWWIENDHDYGTVVGYRCGSNELNNILFEFPKIASVPLFPDGDGEIICLYPVSRDVVQRGLYWEKNCLLNDEVKDWESFWPPIQRMLAKRYSKDGGVRSISSNTTTSGTEIRSLT